MDRFIKADSLKRKWLFRGKDGKPYRDAIDAMPSEDVAPVVHGEWVEDIAYYDDNGCPCIVTRCSNCGEAYPTYNYCPNCGADMRGGTDGGDSI